MATSSVSYESSAYDKIEFGLMQKLVDTRKNVYVSPKFKMMGNECVRIDLESCIYEEQHHHFTVKHYGVCVYYYTDADMTNQNTNKEVKQRIDKLEQELLNSQYNSSGTDGSSNKWINLLINEIEFNAEVEDENIYCAKFNLTLTNTNQF
tara:strand:- start:35467 stop:35916 length:450 start_codon:yes stop_codon:yes gene_type:complete